MADYIYSILGLNGLVTAYLTALCEWNARNES